MDILVIRYSSIFYICEMAPLPLQLQQFRVQLKKYVDFTDAEWAILSRHLYQIDLRKKELFVVAGKGCYEIGFILEGSFRLFYVKDGIEMSSYFCFTNEFITSYRAFLKQIVSEVSIDAMENSTLLCFNRNSFDVLLEDGIVGHKMQRFARAIAEELVCCYEERVLSFVTKTPEERYMMLIESESSFLQKVPQHYIANYLGITPVSLSRIRKRLNTPNYKTRLAS